MALNHTLVLAIVRTINIEMVLRVGQCTLALAALSRQLVMQLLFDPVSDSGDLGRALVLPLPSVAAASVLHRPIPSCNELITTRTAK